MNPPLTIEQYLGVFVAYNAAIWPAQIVAYVPRAPHALFTPDPQWHETPP